MTALFAVLGLISAILISAASKLVADDVKAWQPTITHWLIERAVRRLPENERERYALEWLAYIYDTPGDLSKILRAIGLSFAARSMARIARFENSSELGARIEEGIRRAFDLACSFSILLLCAPLLIICIVAIKLDSPGHSIMIQRRVGQNGRVFSLYKLRTMSIAPGRPSVTRVGRFLRRARIDEMASLLNIVRGDMSFVGPRAERTETVSRRSKMIPDYLHRNKVKPGLTGLAQISRLYVTSDEEAERMLRLDQHYIEDRSLWLDLRILLLTLKVVLWP